MDPASGQAGDRRLGTIVDPIVFDESDDACGGDIIRCPQISSTFMFIVCHPAASEVSVRERTVFPVFFSFGRLSKFGAFLGGSCVCFSF